MTAAATPTWALPLQWPLAMVSGTRLHKDLSVGACRLVAAIGFLQLIASSFSALGMNAFITSLQWHNQPTPPWSWLLAFVLILVFIGFDTALNHVLNLTEGPGHWLLKAMRLMLTVYLSLLASQMLLLMAYADDLAQPAQSIAKARFDDSLEVQAKAWADAKKALTDAQVKLADHAKAAPSASTAPASCAPDSAILPETDVAGRRMQANTQRLCATQVAQGNAVFNVQAKAYDKGMAALAQSVTDATDNATEAKKALDTAEKDRGTTEAKLANTSAIREAAFTKLRNNDTGFNTKYYVLSGLGLLLEMFALVCKVAAARLDEGALVDKEELIGKALDLHSQIDALRLLMRFGGGAVNSAAAKNAAQAARSSMLKAHITEKSTLPVSAKIFQFNR